MYLFDDNNTVLPMFNAKYKLGITCDIYGNADRKLLLYKRAIMTRMSVFVCVWRVFNGF